MLSKSRLKYIQSLSHKKFRKEAPLFLVEGPKGLEEVLKEAPEAIEAIYGLREWAEGRAGVPAFTEITAQELAKISQLSTPNQVLALVRKPENPLPFAPEAPLSLFLETVQDPGNMGTIIRLADWFGVKQVMATPDSVDFFHPKVVQSTMGSILRVNCMEMEADRFFEQVGATPVWAATLDGTDVSGMEKPASAILAIGNESRGLSEVFLSRATQKITIPRFGKAESLNAAMATAVLLGWWKL